MPDFLKMQGTVGKPKANIDKLALVELAAQSGGGVVKGIGGAVGGLFGESKSSTTNSVPAATNASPAASLLNLFKK